MCVHVCDQFTHRHTHGIIQKQNLEEELRSHKGGNGEHTHKGRAGLGRGGDGLLLHGGVLHLDDIRGLGDGSGGVHDHSRHGINGLGGGVSGSSGGGSGGGGGGVRGGGGGFLDGGEGGAGRQGVSEADEGRGRHGKLAVLDHGQEEREVDGLASGELGGGHDGEGRGELVQGLDVEVLGGGGEGDLAEVGGAGVGQLALHPGVVDVTCLIM